MKAPKPFNEFFAVFCSIIGDPYFWIFHRVGVNEKGTLNTPLFDFIIQTRLRFYKVWTTVFIFRIVSQISS